MITVLSVSGTSAPTLAGLRELVRAAESAGLPGDSTFEIAVTGSRIDLEIVASRDLAIPGTDSASRVSRVPSAIEIADALRAGSGSGSRFA